MLIVGGQQSVELELRMHYLNFHRYYLARAALAKLCAFRALEPRSGTWSMVLSLVSYAGSIERHRDPQVKMLQSS